MARANPVGTAGSKSGGGSFFWPPIVDLFLQGFQQEIRRVQFYLASHSRPDSLISIGFIRFCP